MPKQTPTAAAGCLPCSGRLGAGAYLAATAARPFLKWAGGKTQLLPALLEHCPRFSGRYYEPFVGGGALFFALRPRKATLADLNGGLIEAYTVVQRQVEALIAATVDLRADANTYYQVRAADPARLSPVHRAARLLYLNRTCFNGLWRVNGRGQFNVPFGRPSQQAHWLPATLADNLRRAAVALKGASLRAGDVLRVCQRARAGDMVYFDPPYHPLSPTACFRAYSRPPFGEAQQRLLAGAFARLADRGVHVMLSNSDTPLIRELYRGFVQRRIWARRAINSQGHGRGPVPELLVTTG